MPQATGWAGAGGGGLVSQPTGFQDPRLQMMQSSFMPMNTASVSRASTLSPSLLRRSLPHAVGRAAPEPRTPPFALLLALRLLTAPFLLLSKKADSDPLFLPCSPTGLVALSPSSSPTSPLATCRLR